jgi:hypothetical protein
MKLLGDMTLRFTMMVNRVEHGAEHNDTDDHANPQYEHMQTIQLMTDLRNPLH